MENTILVSLDGREDFANEIVDFIDNHKIKNKVSLDTVTSQKFSDGELCPDFDNSIRGKRVYILTSANDSNKLMNLNLAIDAAKRAAAKEIIPILPYFPFYLKNIILKNLVLEILKLILPNHINIFIISAY